MEHQDIPWRQRFVQFQKALVQMGKAIKLSQTRPLSEIEKLGLIKAFEFTHELAWNLMKEIIEHQGDTSVVDVRGATREAFSRNLISDGESWMDMIKSRDQTAYTFNPETADEIAEKAIRLYYNGFLELVRSCRVSAMTTEDGNLKYGLKTAAISKINTVFAGYREIQKVILYGSRAKGNYRKSSDIDLAIVAESITISQLVKIDNELDDLLLPYKIDLSSLEDVKDSDLLSHIRRVGKVFYQAECLT